MKKILSLLLALALALSLCGCSEKPDNPSSETESVSESSVVSSETEQETRPRETVQPITGTPDDEPTTEEDEITEKVIENPEIVTDSLSYCVLDGDGKVWLSKHEFTPYAPASITKVLTLLITCESVSLDAVVTVREEDLWNGIQVMSSGVTPSLKPEEKLTVRDLLNALIMPSTNAAGNVLASFVSGSVEAFVDRMNEKVAALGLTHSHFNNPHGLDDPNHYTCAYDMAVIMKAAMENPLAAEILGASGYVIPATEYAEAREMAPVDSMVNGSYYVEGVDGGKSGSSLNAKSTLVTSVKRGSLRFYVCTMQSDEKMHYVDTENLIEYAYGYANGNAKAKGILHNLYVSGEDENGIEFTFTADNGPIRYRAVWWDTSKGTSAAHFGETHEVDGERKVRINFDTKGTYTVQFFTVHENGKETQAYRNVLFTGERKNTCEIFEYNGNDYYLDAQGFLKVGAIETTGGCYYSNSLGAILKNCQANGRFHAGEDGRIVTGWFKNKYDLYYAGADGRIVEDDCVIGGVLYHFTSYGALIQDSTGK